MQHDQTEGARAMVKAVVLGVKKQAESPQASADEPDHDRLFGNQFAAPRFTPRMWLQLSEHSTRLRRCMETLARNAVGLGVRAVVAPSIAAQVSGKRNLAIRATRDVQALTKFLMRPNDRRDPITEVLFKAEYDVQGCGNGYLEVVEVDREALQGVVALNHVPAADARVSVMLDKYVRIMPRSGKKIYFRRFGDPDPARRFIDRDTGQFYASWPSELPFFRRGTSIIHVKTYNPLDDYYGLPPVVSAVDAVVGNVLVGKWNLNFMHNNAHIPMVVIVENGNLSPDSLEQIDLFTSTEAKGIQNAGRVMLLQPDLDKQINGANLKIRVESVKMGIGEDASFLKFRGENDKEIQEAFGLASILLGTGDAQTRATANAAKQSTLEQVIGPRTAHWEWVLNAEVVPQVINDSVALKLRRPTNLDDLQKASVLQKLMSGLSVDDVRRQVAELAQDESIQELGTDEAKIPIGMVKLRVAQISRDALDDLGEPDEPASKGVLVLTTHKNFRPIAA